MQAVVLVGGQGTRLRPLTLTTPKPLVPLANRPVIEHIALWLARYGVDDVILATQYQAQAFAPWMRRWQRSHIDVNIRAVEEPEPRGTAGAVANVARLLHGTTIVVNGDNLQNLDLNAMHEKHRATGAVATISTDAVDDPTGRGVVVSDDQGRVSRFQEKPTPGTALGRTVNTGVYLVEPEALAAIPNDRFCNWEQDVFPALIGSGAHVQAFQSEHVWIDTGTPGGYFRAQAAVLAGQASAPDGIFVQGVWQDDSVTIDGNAELSGGIAIGFGTMIAAGARLHTCSVGRECYVLTGAAISESAIWDHCQIESDVRIHNSIVGYNCYIGKGAQVATALIGDGCIIGAGAIVPPNTVLLPQTTFP